MAVKDWAFVSFLASFVSLGAFVAGFNIGVLNGLQNFEGFLEFFELGSSVENATCTETSHLTEGNRLILGTIISVASLGGLIGNLLAGKPADYFGRKVTLIVSGGLMVMGTAIQSAAVEGALWMLILGRIIAGLGYGAFYMAGPVYIAEIAPKNIRGSLSSLVGINITLGILFGYVINILLFDKSYGWRTSNLISCSMCCIYTVGVALVPKSPRWLMLKGRESEAREVLRKTSSKLGQDGIEAELEDIRQTLESGKDTNFLQELKHVLKWKNFKRILLGATLHIFTSACGTGIFFYSEPLFCSLGVAPFVTAIVIGIMSFCGTLFTTFFIEKLGRKLMLVGGGFILTLLTGVAATLVLVFNLQEDNNDVIGYIVVCLVCVYMFVFSATWYVVPYVVTSEIFPLDGRGIMVGIASATAWGSIYALTQAFPSIQASFQTFGTLYMFCFIDLCAALFSLFLLPETKGVSLEEMETIFAKPWLERVGLTRCFRFCRRSAGVPDSGVSGESNGVVLTGGQLKEEEVHTDRQRRSDFENNKEWEDYWEHYEIELRDTVRDTTAKQTTV